MIRRFPVLFVLLVAGCTVQTDDAPRPEDLRAPDAAERIARIESEIVLSRIFDEEPGPTLAERMNQLDVPAVSVAVFEDGEIAWAKAYGMADREEVRPAATNTLFQAASISKPVAAVAMHDMVEDGLLDLDADVNTFLESWQMPDNEFTVGHPVTLRGLVNHTAGTTVWGFPGYARSDTLPTTVQVLDGEGNTDSVRVYKTPGESWQYSGGGYTVMQLVLQDVAGRPFAEVVRDRVLRPAGMTQSTYVQPLPEDRHDEAATGYSGDGNPVEEKWHVYPEQAAAGLWTTPTDLARFALTVLDDLNGAGTVLDKETVEAMITPGMNGHGLGPGISGDGLRFGHGGANEGFRCQLTAFIDGRGGIAVMTNSDSGGTLGHEIALTVAREYGWPGMEPERVELATLSPAEYRRLEGTYGFEFGDVVVSYGEETGLMAVLPDGDSLTFRPVSATEFFLLEGPERMVFEIQDGAAVTLVVDGRMRGERR